MPEEDPALPPDPAFLNRQPKWFKPVFHGAIVASILFVLALFFAPLLLRSRKKSNQTEATSNARQIGLALFEFETDYGEFPNETTKALVKNNPGTTIDLTGTSSNTLFRQIFAANITQSESMFFAKTKDSRKPDGIITPENILESGECGFSYIAGLSSKDDPSTPIALTPLIPGTTKFDPKPFKGFAVVLQIDNSVRSYKIENDGHIYRDGKNLLSPKHPIWKGIAPDIRYPDL